MIFRRKGGAPAWLRLLSLSMAVLLSIMLIPAVSAEDELTADTAVETVQETDTAVPEAEVPATVSYDEFQVVWNDLIDPETEKTHKESIKNITKDTSPFLYQEVLDAMDLCRNAVTMQTEQKELINKLLAKIDADVYFDETIKSYYVETLDIFLKGYPSMDFVAILLEDMSSYPAQEIQTDAFLDAIKGMQQQNIEIANLDALLDVSDSWKNLNDQLAEYIPEQDGKLSTMVEESRKTAEMLKADIENFFALNDPEKQAGLDEEIEKLEQTVESFPILRTILSSPLMQDQEDQIAQLQEQIIQLQDQLHQMQKELSAVSGKSVFAFIALGISILAIVMGIVAAVCALKKKDSDNIDAVQAAIRLDIEAVNMQNALLRGRIDLLYKKLDEQKEPAPAPTVDLTQVHALERRLAALEEKLRDNLTPAPKSVPVLDSVPDPLPPVVAKLHLNYQSVNPRNSYLYPHEGGEYILYSDNTVALSEGEFRKVNELKGWKDNGVLHMFRPEIDGKVYDNYENLPSGYYEAVELKARASVKKTGENMYMLLEKGCISMKR